MAIPTFLKNKVAGALDMQNAYQKAQTAKDAELRPRGAGGAPQARHFCRSLRQKLRPSFFGVISAALRGIPPAATKTSPPGGSTGMPPCEKRRFGSPPPRPRGWPGASDGVGMDLEEQKASANHATSAKENINGTFC